MKKNDKKIVMGIIAMVVLVALAVAIALWPKGEDPSLENSTRSTIGTQTSGYSAPFISFPVTESVVTVPHTTVPVDITLPVTQAPTTIPVTNPIVEVSIHTHAYVDTVVKPTCEEEGYTLRTCSCGHSYQDTVVEAKGHTMSTTVVNVTCTQAGYTKNTCSVCGHSYTYNNTPAAGHSYGDWVTVKEATETEQGQLKRTCSTCGEVNTQVVPVIGEVRESYIDPRIEMRIVGRNQNRNYTYGNVGVTDKSSWDNSLSIYITDAGGFYITYYLQDGTKVEYTLAPPSEGYIRDFLIKTDGTYLVGLIGDFSD